MEDNMSILDSQDVYKTSLSSVERYNCCKIYTISSNIGSGKMTSYYLSDGIEVIFSDIMLKQLIKDNYRFDMDTIEINYCLKGNVEAKFKSKKIAYINNGDISLFGYNSDIDYCDFTKKPYKGIVIFININKASDLIHQFTGLTKKEISDFVKKVVNAKTCVVTNAKKSLDHIFKELYVLPEKYKLQHMKIKVMELLLYLISEMDYDLSINNYLPVQFIDKINEAYNLLTKDLSTHTTISEIADKIEVNITDLKSSFKMIYGDSMYATLRKKRLQKARELLIEKSINIVEISSLVGYSNPSKFANAFKKVYGINPSTYRKQNKLQG